MNIAIVGCGNVGFETARLLADRHALLLVNRSRPADLARFVDENDRVSFAQADAADPRGIQEAFAGFEERVGPLDALISTVGVPGVASALDGYARFKEEFRLNVFANLVPVKIALDHMAAHRQGKIVAISSTSGVHTYPGWGAYAPAKWALTNLCRTLRKEAGPHGIAVDVVFPRTIRNQRSKTFLNDAGVEPLQVAREVVKVLAAARPCDRFVPRRHALLRVLERVFPQVLDRKAGLRKDRCCRFRAESAHRVLIHEPDASLGLELARRYAATAKALYLAGSDEPVLTTIEKELGHSSSCTVEGVVLPEGDADAVQRLAVQTGTVDLIVHCGVSSSPAELREMSFDACEQSMEVSFFQPLQVLMAYARQEVRPRKIVNVLSMSAVTGRAQYACWSAAQAALWAQTRALRRTMGNDVQVMEVLLSEWDGPRGERSGNGAICEAADRICDAEQRGREIVVFPLHRRIAMVLDAIGLRRFS